MTLSTAPFLTPFLIVKNSENVPFHLTFATWCIYTQIMSLINLGDKFALMSFLNMILCLTRLKAFVMSIMQVKTSDPFFM